MSKNPEKEDWEKRIAQLLQNEIKPLRIEIEKLKSPPSSAELSTEQHTEAHKTHETIEDLLACPECYPPVRKGVIEKEFKGADYECVECGLPVRGEKSEKADWECPSCGAKYAKPRKE